MKIKKLRGALVVAASLFGIGIGNAEPYYCTGYRADLVEDIEKRMIQQALERTHGVKKRAAELLHVSFRSFRYRLEKYAMNDRDQAAAVGE